MPILRDSCSHHNVTETNLSGHTTDADMNWLPFPLELVNAKPCAMYDSGLGTMTIIFLRTGNIGSIDLNDMDIRILIYDLCCLSLGNLRLDRESSTDMGSGNGRGCCRLDVPAGSDRI
jgi:hypothetical protein